MAAKVLRRGVAKASAAMVLSKSSRNIPNSATKSRIQNGLGTHYLRKCAFCVLGTDSI